MNEKRRPGRPSTYIEDIHPMMADYYLESYQDRDEAIPTIAGLAVYLGIARDTVYDWGEKYPEFSDKLARLLAVQERDLENNGLRGTYNSTITKLLLASVHGHSDRAVVDNTSSDGSMSPQVTNVNLDPETIRKIAKELDSEC